MDINYEDERWAHMANNIPPEIPEDDLYLEIEKQYELNKAQLADNQKSIPVKLSKNMEEINDSMYASSKAIATSKHNKELIRDLQKNRLVGLRILGQEIKYATTLTYQNLLKPVRSLMKQFHQSDIRAYKKDIARATRQYEKVKESIDRKARKRMRRINLFNMRRGYFIYDEKTLPYTEAEQWKMDKYIAKLNVLNNLLQDSESRLAKVISAEEKNKDALDRARETIVSLKEEQRQPYIVPKEANEREVVVSDPKEKEPERVYEQPKEQPKRTPSIDKEFNKSQNAEMKKIEQGVPDTVIKDLKKQYLTNGQYHAALLVSQKFPQLQIEKDPYLKEMDPPKIVMAAYIMDKWEHEEHTLERLSKLSTVQLMEVGSMIDRGYDKSEIWNHINNDEAKEPVKPETPQSKEEPIVEKVVDITYSDDLNVAEVTKVVGDTTPAPEVHSNADNERTGAYDNRTLFDRSFTENMRLAADAAMLMQATRAYEVIKDRVQENRAVDFEVDGDAYRAQKDHSGEFYFTKYDYETSTYTPIDKDTAIVLISQNSKDFLAFVKEEQETNKNKGKDMNFSDSGMDR